MSYFVLNFFCDKFKALRPWFSGRTGPCQGPGGVSITPGRTLRQAQCKQIKYVIICPCTRGEMDITTRFGRVIVGSSPAGSAQV